MLPPTSVDFLSSPIFEFGFLPSPEEAKLSSQPLDGPYTAWEDALASALSTPLRIADDSEAARRWRANVVKMNVLPVIPIQNRTGQLQRAHHILTFLAHFYVHSLPESESKRPVLPASISVPLLIVSHLLEMPPVLIYADTEFYNFSASPAFNKPAFATAEDISVAHAFTGTPDEVHFFLTSLLIEAEGANSLHAMRDILGILKNKTTSTEALDMLLFKLAASTRRMAEILDAVREGCDPNVYYGEVRHWFNGSSADDEKAWRFAIDRPSDAAEADTLQAVLLGNKWVRTVRGKHAVMAEMAGATAAQSSIIQALDAFLGISVQTHVAETFSLANGNKGSFLEKMRQYMPRDQRIFLSGLACEGAKLRQEVTEGGFGDQAKVAYNEAVEALREFRTLHVKIATLYIVNPQRRAQSLGNSPVSGGDSGAAVEPELYGTGGTALVPFLKDIRDRTEAASLK